MTGSVESVVLRSKRADTPFSRSTRKVIDSCFTATIPVPQIFKPAGRLFCELRFYLPILWKRVKSLIYTTPRFCSRCESVGRHLQLCAALPDVHGHALLYLGAMDVTASRVDQVSSVRLVEIHCRNCRNAAPRWLHLDFCSAVSSANVFLI